MCVCVCVCVCVHVSVVCGGSGRLLEDVSLTLIMYEGSPENMFASGQCQCHHVTDLSTTTYAHVVIWL
jgi:hypothetical protein